MASPQTDPNAWGANDTPVASTPASASSAWGSNDTPVSAAANNGSFDQGVQQAVQQARTEDAQAPAGRGVLGAIQDFGNAAAHHVVNAAVGLGQGFSNLYGGAVDAVLPANSQFRKDTDQATQAGNDYVAQREADYQASVPTNTASVLGATAGEVAPFLLDAPAKGLQAVGEAAKFLPEAGSAIARYGNKILSGAAQGATVAAAQPVTNAAQSYAAQKLAQVGTGAALGGAVPAAINAPGAVMSAIAPTVDPVTAQLAGKAAAHGIDLTAPQVSDSVPLKVANSTTAQFPFSGAQAFANKQQGQFNNAVAQTIGLPQGTTKITPDVFATAKQQASNGFNDLWNRNNLNLTPDVLSKVVGIANDAQQLGGQDSGTALNTIIDRLAAQGSSGVLPGRAFQSVDSQLGQMTGMGGEKGYYAGQLQDALRDGMQSSMTGQDAQQLQNLRGVWQNIKNLTPIVAKQTDGNIPPAQLMGAVTGSGSGKAQMATGARGDLGDLAQIGQRFLKNQVPDSGTALRTTSMDALKGLGAVTAGATTGVGVAPVVGTLAGARLIQQGLRSRALYNALTVTPNAAAPVSQNALIRYLPAIAAQQQQPMPMQNALAAPQYQGVTP